MNLAPEILAIVDFIKERSHKLYLNDWPPEQIANYVIEKIRLKQMIFVEENSVITGVVFFQPAIYAIYIEQIWCSNKRAMLVFLRILQDNWPKVQKIKAYHQRRCREISFNLTQFIRIYGR